LPETPGTYLAWRQLAAAYVRQGRLPEALEAYRQADRRAPAEDRAEIAARLGWLTKETGDAGGARRYFARSRGADRLPAVTYGLIAITSIVSILAFLPDWTFLFDAFQLDKAAVAHGEYWRLLSSTLLHAGWIHLLFNMYALYFGGALVERIYGGRLMLLMYVVTGIAASTASFVFGSDIPSIGASGAIFGMFGVLVAAARAHNPIVDRRSQAILGQIGVLIVINLFIGFVVPGIDYFAHIGGLVAGLWLGLIIVPGRVPTLSSLWQRPAGAPDTGIGSGVLQVLGVLALLALIVAGLMIGTQERRGGAAGSSTTAGETVAVVAVSGDVRS
jgi:membrane associated rhomboid family serine protease